MVKRVGAWLFHLLGLMAKLPRQDVCKLTGTSHCSSLNDRFGAAA